jgi:hypothetical protein
MEMSELGNIPEEYCGPALLSLSSKRQRVFAYLMGSGEQNRTECVRLAGYPGTPDNWKREAYRLMQKPAVVEAVQEVARKALSGLVPMALQTIREVMADPTNPQRARVAETILDRTGYSAKTEHRVTVEHRADMALLEEFARRLATESGLPADHFLPEPKIIDAERVLIPPPEDPESVS